MVPPENQLPRWPKLRGTHFLLFRPSQPWPGLLSAERSICRFFIHEGGSLLAVLRPVPQGS